MYSKKALVFSVARPADSRPQKNVESLLEVRSPIEWSQDGKLQRNSAVCRLESDGSLNLVVVDGVLVKCGKEEHVPLLKLVGAVKLDQAERVSTLTG